MSQVLRRIVVSEPTGDNAYRTTLDSAFVKYGGGLFAFVSENRVRKWIGPSAHAIASLVQNNTQLNVVVLIQDESEDSENTPCAERPVHIAETCDGFSAVGTPCKCWPETGNR